MENYASEYSKDGLGLVPRNPDDLSSIHGPFEAVSEGSNPGSYTRPRTPQPVNVLSTSISHTNAQSSIVISKIESVISLVMDCLTADRVLQMPIQRRPRSMLLPDSRSIQASREHTTQVISYPGTTANEAWRFGLVDY
jgi:hypothetical protein